jgi:hypothetical protein
MPSDVATAVMGVFEPSERTEILESIVADLVAEADRLSLHGRADYPVRAFSHAAQTRAILAGRALFDADTISGRPHVFPALIVLSLERLGDESILWLEELTRAQPMLAERLLPDTRLALHTLVKARVARATGPTLAALIALAGALAGPMQTGAGDPQAL